MEYSAKAKAAEFLGILERRYACKRFSTEYKPDKDTISYILECGRRAPSSLGLEPWHFSIFSSREGIKTLGDFCFAQEAVYTSSFAVAILVQKGSCFKPDSEFIQRRAERFPGGYAVFEPDYRPYYEFLESVRRTEHWARAQSYIAASFMMLGATSIGLDSCPIEGFDETALLRFLDKDEKQWLPGIVVVFGKRDEEIRQKIREPLENLTEFI
ncbi:MAG: nitroreductase family protein [Spirochaetales bacterium]|nr:nitroreductase family protein [Spirochaetales bacterium]